MGGKAGKTQLRLPQLSVLSAHGNTLTNKRLFRISSREKVLSFVEPPSGPRKGLQMKKSNFKVCTASLLILTSINFIPYYIKSGKKFIDKI